MASGVLSYGIISTRVNGIVYTTLERPAVMYGAEIGEEVGRGRNEDVE